MQVTLHFETFFLNMLYTNKYSQNLIFGIYVRRNTGRSSSTDYKMPAYLKGNCNSSTISINIPIPSFVKICSAVLKLLRAYTWTDEAILPALHTDVISPKNKFNIHPVQGTRTPVENPSAQELSMQYACQNGRFYH